MEIEVKGHSGCQIDIVRENNDLFIYKSSYDHNYLDRLVKQAQKQQNAWEQEYRHIRIPEIFNVERDENHVTIKMEYIYSRNFIEYFEAAGFEQVEYFIKAIISFIEKELNTSPLQLIPTSITLNKFQDVKKKIFKNPLLNDNKEIANILLESEKHFAAFAKVKAIKLPLGSCHGDLTFSNILFNGNNYYLIDFLDSFIESPLLDIVKIRQDSFHMWSQLMYTKKYDRLRLRIICNKIDQMINSHFCKYDWYRQYYKIYQLMNLLRILQYAKEEVVVKYLEDSIKGLLDSNKQAEREDINSIKKEENRFDLIVPVAADNDQDPDCMPYVFGLDEKGVMLCVKSIMGLNLNVFDNIYFTILKKHAELFNVEMMLALQFERLGIRNIDIVVLDEPSSSQTETIYRTIKKKEISGGIFIKDADGYFDAKIERENCICVYPLEEMSIVDPQHKSYVMVDDGYCITNIIEKRVVSHFINDGGYGFKNADDYVLYYEKYSKGKRMLYVSHIVYAMLLEKNIFRPLKTSNFIDWGNADLFQYLVLKKQK